MTFDCPVCGVQVPARARSCPECGADEETGWSEDTLYDGLDLPDPGYAPPDAPSRNASWLGTSGRVVAIVLLILIGLLLFWRP